MAVSLLAALLGFRDVVSATIKNMTLDELKRAALRVAALDGPAPDPSCALAAPEAQELLDTGAQPPRLATSCAPSPCRNASHQLKQFAKLATSRSPTSTNRPALPLVVTAWLPLNRSQTKHGYDLRHTLGVPAHYVIFCASTDECQELRDARSAMEPFRTDVQPNWSVRRVAEVVARAAGVDVEALQSAAEHSAIGPGDCTSGALVLLWVAKPVFLLLAMVAYPEQQRFAWVDAGFNRYREDSGHVPPAPWLTAFPERGLAVRAHTAACHNNKLAHRNHPACFVGTYLFGTRHAWSRFAVPYLARVRDLITTQDEWRAKRLHMLCQDQDIFTEVALGDLSLVEFITPPSLWGWHDVTGLVAVGDECAPRNSSRPADAARHGEQGRDAFAQRHDVTSSPHSLQSFLDTCSQGHFDNSSNWLPQHPHCRHVVPQEHTGRHIAPNDPGVASCFPRSHKPLWLHVAGDSTMRFFYAGLLSFFNGTAHRAPGFPLHWLPNDDACAFAKVGWPGDSKNECYKRWRGKCDELAPNGCFLDARGTRADGLAWRVSFSWWHSEKYNAARTKALEAPWRNESAAPLAVLVGLGVWEGMWTTRTNTAPTKVYADAVGLSLAKVARMRDQLGGGSAVFVLGNGGCRRQQEQWRPLVGAIADHPGASYEAQVVGKGNAMLESFALNHSGASGGGPVLFVNRSALIAGAAAVSGAPAMSESPCFHFHPYGALTDLSVCLALRAVHAYAHGFD